MITNEQKLLVKTSWAKVEPIADQAARLFYGRLFELDPSLTPLFKSDMTEQGVKLMKMIGITVHGLDHLDKLIDPLQKLGRRHVGYGVTPEHYDTVGAALLWTLEAGLGDAFTSDVKQAWADTYGLLAQVMLDAAREAA